MLVSLIAAIGENRELGAKNKLLWHIPEDMKHFRDTTRGHTVVMGRKTFESIGKALPNRTNIVLTREKREIQGCITVLTPEEALEIARENKEEEVFIIGGAEIYALFLPFADRIYLTLVQQSFPHADAFFPPYTEFENVVSRIDKEDNNYKYSFLVLEK